MLFRKFFTFSKILLTYLFIPTIYLGVFYFYFYFIFCFIHFNYTFVPRNSVDREYQEEGSLFRKFFEENSNVCAVFDYLFYFFHFFVRLIFPLFYNFIHFKYTFVPRNSVDREYQESGERGSKFRCFANSSKKIQIFLGIFDYLFIFCFFFFFFFFVL